MEKKLKILFDFQRFRKNDRLEKIISSVDADEIVTLSAEDLSFVNAAGSPEAFQKDMENFEDYLNFLNKGRT